MLTHKKLGLAVSALLLVSCSSNPSIAEDPNAASYRTIKISQGVNNETKLVAHLYAEALQEVGYHTEVVDTGKSRAQYLAQLQKNPETEADDAIDLAPDYSGELLMHLTDDGKYSVAYLEQQAEKNQTQETGPANPENTTAAQDISLNVTSLNSESIHNSIQRLLPDGLEALDPSNADPKHGLYITRATAGAKGYTALTDLTKDCPQLTIALPEATENSSYLTESLTTYYNCTPQNTVQKTNQTQRTLELTRDEVQLADLRETLPEVQDNALIRLEDPSNIFINQNITPMMRSEELPTSARNAINTVSAQLNNDELRKLLRLTQGEDAISYENAAKFWVKHTQE